MIEVKTTAITKQQFHQLSEKRLHECVLSYKPEQYCIPTPVHHSKFLLEPKASANRSLQSPGLLQYTVITLLCLEINQKLGHHRQDLFRHVPEYKLFWNASHSICQATHPNFLQIVSLSLDRPGPHRQTKVNVQLSSLDPQKPCLETDKPFCPENDGGGFDRQRRIILIELEYSKCTG